MQHMTRNDFKQLKARKLKQVYIKLFCVTFVVQAIAKLLKVVLRHPDEFTR